MASEQNGTRRNVVLSIGQNKNPAFFQQSVNVYIQHAGVAAVVLVVWDTMDMKDMQVVVMHPKVRVVRVPPAQFGIQSQYQHHLYHIGLQYIQDHFEETERLYVLKTRLDVLISKEQLSFVFAQDYRKRENVDCSFRYKIWIPWAHLTVPLYVEDACFYSHVSVMHQVIPPKSMQVPSDFQGHLHLRWFLTLGQAYNIYPGLEAFSSFEAYYAQHPEYEGLLGQFTLDAARIRLLQAYWGLIHQHFIVHTIPDGIHFRVWSAVTYYRPPSTSIRDIIRVPAPSNLKIAYSEQTFDALRLRGWRTWCA